MIFIIGVYDYLAVVIRTVPDTFPFRAGKDPRLSAVIRAVYPVAGCGFGGWFAIKKFFMSFLIRDSRRVGIVNGRIKDIGIFRIYSQADLSQKTIRQPLCKFFPGSAAVCGLVYPASRSCCAE